MPIIQLARELADPAILDAVLGPAAAGGARRVPAGAESGAACLLDLAEADAGRLAFSLRAIGCAPAPAVAGRDGALPAAAFGAPPRDIASLAPGLLTEILGEIAALYPDAAAATPARVAPRAIARLRGRATAVPARLRTARGDGDLVQLDLSRPYAGHFAVEEHRLSHRRFDGAMSPPLERSVFTSGDAVNVLPYDPRRDSVLLLEQFRPGPAARCDPNPWCLEVVAGRCDSDESAEETARREAEEEAGLVLGRLERITGYYASPGIAAEHTTAFVGEADLGGGGGIHGLDDEHEDIRTLVVPRAEALAAVASGEANNAPLVMSLLWLELNADRLRRDWGGA